MAEAEERELTDLEKEAELFFARGSQWNISLPKANGFGYDDYQYIGISVVRLGNGGSWRKKSCTCH